MGKNSKTHVASMSSGDFANNEQSITLENATSINIQHLNKLGKKTILKKNINL